MKISSIMLINVLQEKFVSGTACVDRYFGFGCTCIELLLRQYVGEELYRNNQTEFDSTLENFTLKYTGIKFDDGTVTLTSDKNTDQRLDLGFKLCKLMTGNNTDMGNRATMFSEIIGESGNG